jgi:hypothetical protein
MRPARRQELGWLSCRRAAKFHSWAMVTPSPQHKWTERPSASVKGSTEDRSMFDLLFERSADAIWLLDPENVVFVDCNQAACN